ncbi:MAG: gamma carbonic anhydrase family protein [Burkholderiaceae bacterium]|nr:gamma carbonic anhydrase family protein [Burkholderiaceae bacterium]MEB2352448.1 gamma carbonic anhydrase family protein [Burkholderiaceae bacterium]
MSIYRLGNRIPRIDASAWVAASADLIGQVELAAESSVWFNCTLRGDNEPIRIGARSNVQDNCVLHTDPGYPLRIGERVTVGHQAMLHGCTIDDEALVGIQAIVLNGARIGRHCLIGAGALVAEGKVIPERSLVLGAPGRVVRQLTDAEVANLLAGTERYVQRARLFRETLACQPRA